VVGQEEDLAIDAVPPAAAQQGAIDVQAHGSKHEVPAAGGLAGGEIEHGVPQRSTAGVVALPDALEIVPPVGVAPGKDA
jgi:hypothetical protein